MARLTALSGDWNLWAGRLWQSMQSIVRMGSWLTSLVNPGERNSVTTPLRVGHAHPGNFLAGRIGGDVFDFVAHVHVPMDAADRPVRGIAAADFEQQTNE
jgi:hypothetical protein